ncbi:MAG: hypothetical protein NTV70_06360 [Acidobacteria bacterium]|nr:hypothetical protein [Acidobacteriota bacterium]
MSFALLRQHTTLPICIASEVPLGLGCEFEVRIIDPHFSYFDKVHYLGNTPFDETVYLDSDVSLFHCMDEVFDGLCGADLLASHEASLGLGPLSKLANIPPSFPELSSGMIVYRKSDAFQKLMSCWVDEYRLLLKTHGIKEDQPSFRRALFLTNIKFSVLPPEYHYIPASFTRVVGEKVFSVHNHDFSRARTIGLAFNTRALGDYSGYVDGLGVFRNPWAMTFREVVAFTSQTARLLTFLLFRSAYIASKRLWKHR